MMFLFVHERIQEVVTILWCNFKISATDNSQCSFKINVTNNLQYNIKINATNSYQHN